MKNPKILKNKNWSFAHKGCLGCVHKNDCVRCSMLNQPHRKVLLSLLGYKQKQNKAMIAGIKQHEKHFKELKELDEYGVKPFYTDLYTGKEIFIKEANVCSPSHGLRGHIDGLKLRYDIKNKEFFFEIQELKPSYNKSYLMQLAGYAIILSDPYCQIVYKKKIRKEHSIPRRLYLQHPIKINAIGKFIYYKTGKEYNLNMINNNQISPMTNGLYSKLKKIRGFMKAGIFHLNELKECSWCADYTCEFKPLCEKYPYTPSKQRYFAVSKNKLLRKTPLIR